MNPLGWLTKPWMDHVWRALSLLVPVGLVAWQINRNYRSNLKLQQEQLKRQVSLEFYKDLVAAWHRVIDKQLEVDGLFRSIELHYDLRLAPDWPAEMKVPPLKFGGTQLTDARSEAGQSLIDLLNVAQKYEVALPGFRPMLIRIQDLHFKVSATFSDLLAYVLPYLPPVPGSIGWNQATLELWPVPTNDGWTQLRARIEEYLACSSDLGCFLEDLRIEMQNHLIGSLFGTAVPTRRAP